MEASETTELPKDEIDEQIEVFEPAPTRKAVERTFTHPDGTEKVFVQKELGFLNKTRFFRLLAGTLRLASETEDNPTDFLQQAFGDVIGPDGEALGDTGSFVTALFHLVELVPDFLEQSYVLILQVKPEDQVWFLAALEEIDDETGVDIIDVFVAQNGKSIRNFFDKRLRNLGKRISQELNLNQESETTT